MKKFVVLFLAAAVLAPVSSLELTTLATSGNLTFNDSSTAPVSTYSGTDFFWGGSIYGEDRITDNITLKAGIFYDPILRYTVNTLFEYQHNFFKLGVGPFSGIFNTSDTIMKSGISTSVRVEIPGIIFAALTADSSISARFINVGDYSQEKNVITVGYYIPNALCSFNLTTKSFVTKQTSSLEVEDSFTEYAFKIDIYQKNIAFRTLLSFAYQTLERIYTNTSTGDTTSNTLNSLIFGTHFTFPVTENVSLLADLESSIYSFGYIDSTAITMPDSGLGSYLFRATAGVRINMDK